MQTPIRAIRGQDVVLHDFELLRRRKENRRYLMALDNDNLLIHHRFEAGLDTRYQESDLLHGGWESPFCQLRGHFVGHWLSAAAMEVHVTGDRELKAKADVVVDELAKCQKSNGGEWCAPIPEKYLSLIAQGKAVWAPQYTIHKTFMGLVDMYEYTGNRQALDIAINFSKWFKNWSAQFDDAEFNRILDVETGGMLEIWSQLYGITKDPIHLELIDRYYRHSLFDGLLTGKDVLTNMHANTTIPEALGAARAYEVTGEAKWLDITKAYWEQAVVQKGYYCTGGQTCGEIWTPNDSFFARLGEKNQEHCTVYNMMRLADFLFRYTGDSAYADYWEKNLYNGIMAQAYYRYEGRGQGVNSEYPEKGLLTYFLPLKSGGVKAWASETQDFFCCHGSLVQANAGHVNGIYYQDESNLYVCQYFPSDLRCVFRDTEVKLSQRTDTLAGNNHMTGSITGSQTINEQATLYQNHPGILRNHLSVSCEDEIEFTINIRVPWWQNGAVNLYINGEKQQPLINNGFISISRSWKNDEVRFEYTKSISTSPLPDRPDTMAFLYGPVVLAGLSEGKALIASDASHPEGILSHANEREWASWKDTFRTTGQDIDINFIPLYKVGYERYSIYFPVRELNNK